MKVADLVRLLFLVPPFHKAAAECCPSCSWQATLSIEPHDLVSAQATIKSNLSVYLTLSMRLDPSAAKSWSWPLSTSLSYLNLSTQSLPREHVDSTAEGIFGNLASLGDDKNVWKKERKFAPTEADFCGVTSADCPAHATVWREREPLIPV